MEGTWQHTGRRSAGEVAESSMPDPLAEREPLGLAWTF